MKKIIKLVLKSYTPNFFKKEIFNFIGNFLNTQNYRSIKAIGRNLPENYKKSIISQLKIIREISTPSNMVLDSLDKSLKNKKPKDIWNIDDICENFEAEDETSIILAPHGIGDAVNVITILYELNKSYPKHKWIIICKEYIGELITKLDLEFVTSYSLNKEKINALLGDPKIHNLPASLNTYEFLQFPRLDKVYLNRDEININENTLTNMNILGKISQSDAYLLLNSELDIFKLLNEEDNFLIPRIRKIFNFNQRAKVNFIVNSENEISIESSNNEERINLLKSKNQKQFIYLLTKASSIESPDDKYIKDIISVLNNKEFCKYSIVTNDLKISRLEKNIIYDPLDLFESIMFIKNNVEYIISPVCGFLNLNISLGTIKNYLSLYPSNSNNSYQFGRYTINPEHYFKQKTFDNRDYVNELLIPYKTDSYDENFKYDFLSKFQDLLNSEMSFKKNKEPLEGKTHLQNQSNLNINIKLNTSAGEIIDKFVIQKIKKRKISSAEKIYHIDKELAILQEKVDFILEKGSENKSQILKLINQLESVNEEAWIKNDEIYFGFEGFFGSEEFNPSIEDLKKDKKLLNSLIQSAKNFRTSQALNKKRVEIKNKITDMVSIGYLEGKSFKQEIYKEN